MFNTLKISKDSGNIHIIHFHQILTPVPTPRLLVNLILDYRGQFQLHYLPRFEGQLNC